MKPYLLDTNVLIALAWPNHVHHREAVAWFQAKASKGFRTCPVTQTGFVRISSHTAFTAQPATPGEAVALLDRLLALPGHEFWPDDVSVPVAFRGACMPVTHRQVTDGYLLALAKARGGILATLDRGIVALARNFSERVELIFG